MIRQEMQLLQHAVKQWEPASNKTSQEQLADSSCGACSRQSDQQRSQLQQQAMDKLAGIAGQLSLSGNRQAIRQQVRAVDTQVHTMPGLAGHMVGKHGSVFCLDDISIAWRPLTVTVIVCCKICATGN